MTFFLLKWDKQSQCKLFGESAGPLTKGNSTQVSCPPLLGQRKHTHRDGWEMGWPYLCGGMDGQHLTTSPLPWIAFVLCTHFLIHTLINTLNTHVLIDNLTQIWVYSCIMHCVKVEGESLPSLILSLSVRRGCTVCFVTEHEHIPECNVM